MVYFEDFIGSAPSKTKVVLENSFFVVKVPDFSDIDNKNYTYLLVLVYLIYIVYLFLLFEKIYH